MKIKGWHPFEIIWLSLFMVLSIILSVISKDTLFNFSVFLSGVICVVLAAKGSIWNFAFGSYNSLMYSYVSYLNGLFGDTILNALYIFPMQVIGWILWKRQLQGKKVIMRKMTLKGIVEVIVLCIIGTVGYGYWLSTLPGQNTPYLNSFSNSMSVVGMILMVRRYREQWGLFVLVDSVSVVMWSYRLINGSPNALLMVVMWSAYLTNSVYGLINWSRGAGMNIRKQGQGQMTTS